MSEKVRKIEVEKAPKAIGPYSQAIALKSSSELIFVSGQLPIDPETGALVDGSIQEQTAKVIDNLEAILEKAGSRLSQTVRVDIFLKELKKDFPGLNKEYSKRFSGFPEPARQTIGVAELPMGASVEISCIAYL